MTARRRDLLSAIVLLSLLVLHAAGKIRAGVLPEMLWACHVATTVLAIGLVAGSRRAIAIGFLFHLGIGVPGYFLDLLVAESTTWTSAALHVGSAIAGGLALRESGLPRRAVLDTWLFYLATQVMGLLAPVEMNLNVAHQPWAGMPFEMSPWVSRGLNAIGALLFLLGAAAVARAVFARYGSAPRSVIVDGKT